MKMGNNPMMYVAVMEFEDHNGVENQFVEVFRLFPTVDDLLAVFEKHKLEALDEGNYDTYLTRSRAIYAIKNLGGMPLVSDLDSSWAIRRGADDIGDFCISICETELY